MSTHESRSFKIDLQIRRGRDNVASPFNNKANQMLPTTRSTNHSKKLNVTVHHRHEQKNSLSSIPHPEPKKIVISEFRVEQDSTVFP